MIAFRIESCGLALWLLLVTLPLMAQKKTALMLGLNPAVTVEPFYEKGELDVNILPIVIQKTLTRRVDLRLISVLNLGIRKTGNQISHVGLEATLPVYLKAKESLAEPSKGLYLAPGYAFTRNRLGRHSNSSFFLEPGYHLSVCPKMSLTFGLQLGRTYFTYDDDATKWDGHFGFKLIIGYWL
jgi:hypothetical protein